ncbi:MAG: TonB family protein [Gammaproteobacteria bacterium]
MAQATAIREPGLPWVETSEDRNFRRLLIALLVIFLVAGLVLDSFTLPETTQKKLVDVSPRLARLILEKQKVKPPLPKIVKAKPEEKKKAEKPKEKKKDKPKEVKKEAPKEKTKLAREVAQQSGLIAFSDELADLRESFDLDNIVELPQQTTGKQATEIASASALLSSQAKQSSGGITTNTLTRKIETSELATRKTTTVTSNIKSTQAVKTTGTSTSQSGRTATRSAEEVERVFQKNKGAIFSIYNRALRKNPSLAGKVVVELTIDPNGKVIKVTIVSSELGDEKLERKLALKIKKFIFASANVSQITVSYPIDFLPS